ncbi:hypothetical protein [Streptomyces cacaoi]|uniref:Uncharacterized protein n=1 Tax=Streptomyces cacaoi TaxID=1898 RepID=A0A4Y3QXC1_STRCI|nr:hypothetical protein [Streptomyces cacaoi]GEB49609.1 hypothetical protein SCA03_21600 [Streptomyces cacaoi]
MFVRSAFSMCSAPPARSVRRSVLGALNVLGVLGALGALDVLGVVGSFGSFGGLGVRRITMQVRWP